jgi:hypothetical protein
MLLAMSLVIHFHSADASSILHFRVEIIHSICFLYVLTFALS